MRQSWTSTVRSCASSVEFGRLLSALAAAQLSSHKFSIRPHRTSLANKKMDREDKKKMEKKKKYEKELEEEMHRLHVVPFTKGIKHNVRF